MYIHILICVYTHVYVYILKGWNRIGWASFESDTAAQAAVKELDGTNVAPLPTNSEVPSSADKRNSSKSEVFFFVWRLYMYEYLFIHICCVCLLSVSMQS